MHTVSFLWLRNNKAAEKLVLNNVIHEIFKKLTCNSYNFLEFKTLFCYNGTSDFMKHKKEGYNYGQTI